MANSSQTTSSTALFLLLLTIALLVGGYAIRHTVSCFLFAFCFAYVLDPFVVFFERRHFRRISGIVFLYSLLTVFAVFCLTYFIPFLTIRWHSLLRDLPFYLQKTKDIVLSWKDQFQPTYAAEEWSWLLDTSIGNLDTLLSKTGSGIYSLAGRMAFNLFNFVLAPILVFFMLQYKHTIVSAITTTLPERWREPALTLGREINDSIGGYIRGQLIVSLIVAILATGALLILDIEYPVLNGIFAGFASILPFIGVFLATLPPLLFAFLKFQSGVVIVKVIAAFAVIYFFEGYLVKPIVFKKSMDLNPLVTIIAVMAFGEVLGFWGILLAIPLVAAGKILSSHLRHGDFIGA